jgi:hypothetical protein
MQVILQGSLRHFDVAALLAFLCRRTEGETALEAHDTVRGTLDLDSAGQRARILFEDDRVVWAEASGIGEPLDALMSALDWRSGNFTVLDSISLPENVAPLGLTFDEITAEAKRRAEERSGYRDAAMFHVIDDPALQQQVSLTSEEFKILFRVAAGKTFRELLAEIPVPRADLAGKLKRLEELGLVTTAREAPQAAPSPLEQTQIGPTHTSAAKRTTAARKRTLVGSLTPDGAPDRVFPLLDSEHTIGRAPDNTVTVADSSVSSRHARILRTAQGFVIEDAQSRNGTFVNGERVTEKRQLADGDLIRIGKIILIFNIARESKTGEVTQPEVRLA